MKKEALKGLKADFFLLFHLIQIYPHPPTSAGSNAPFRFYTVMLNRLCDLLEV